MVELLVANDKEVVFTACGVLINLMADEERRGVFKKLGGVTKYALCIMTFVVANKECSELPRTKMGLLLYSVTVMIAAVHSSNYSKVYDCDIFMLMTSGWSTY